MAAPPASVHKERRAGGVARRQAARRRSGVVRECFFVCFLPRSGLPWPRPTPPSQPCRVVSPGCRRTRCVVARMVRDATTEQKLSNHVVVVHVPDAWTIYTARGASSFACASSWWPRGVATPAPRTRARRCGQSRMQRSTRAPPGGRCTAPRRSSGTASRGLAVQTAKNISVTMSWQGARTQTHTQPHTQPHTRPHTHTPTHSHTATRTRTHTQSPCEHAPFT